MSMLVEALVIDAYIVVVSGAIATIFLQTNHSCQFLITQYYHCY